MIGETTLAMLYVPLLFYVFERFGERGKEKSKERTKESNEEETNAGRRVEPGEEITAADPPREARHES
jgi:hypothetical protein